MVSDSELENVDALDGERKPLDVPAGVTWTQEPDAVRVGHVRVGRHLPALPAAAQRLRRVDQTGNDVRDGRLDRDGEVATAGAPVRHVHRTVAVLFCAQTDNNWTTF